jgi:hypothetical protein
MKKTATLKRLMFLTLALFAQDSFAQSESMRCYFGDESYTAPSESGGSTYSVSYSPCVPASSTFTSIYQPKETYIPSGTSTVNPFAVCKTIKVVVHVVNPYFDPSGTQVNFKSGDLTYLQSVIDRANYLLEHNQAPTDGITISGRSPYITDTKLRISADDIVFETSDFNYSNSSTTFTTSMLTRPDEVLNIFVLWDEDVFPSTTAPAGGVSLGTPQYPYSGSTSDDLLAGENRGQSFIILKGLYQNTYTRFNLNWTANLLLHELGHELGLHHTYGTDWGTATGTERNEPYYDYLADIFNVGGAKKYPRPSNSADCQDLAKASISSTDYWINNFMSGNPEGQNISPMQLGRIHRNAHFLCNRKYMYNTNPEDVGHDGTGEGQINPVIVNSNQTWDFDIKMYNDIVVKTGNTLTITCRVFMPFHSNIIVEKGAKLVLDGGLITSDRPNTMWYGISVFGQSHLSQDAAGAQGIIEVKNGATISNALHAITLGDAVHYSSGTTGGIARITDAHFINNRSSIGFSDYENKAVWPAGVIKPNRSYITNTTFVVDDNYKMDGPLVKGPIEQLAASGVRGIAIKGCTFDNQMSTATRAIFGSGYAIHTYDASYTVADYCASMTYGIPCSSTTLVPSIIRGYQIGILSSNVTKADKAVQVMSTSFEDNSFGFYGGTVNTADIHHNSFVIKDLTSLVNTPVGVRLETSTNFNVQENTFENQEYSTHYFPIYAPHPWYGISHVKTGVLVDRCGSDNNVIRRNTYDFLMFGNYSRKLNTNGYSSLWTTEADAKGLEFKCNTYHLNTNDQYILGSDLTNHGMRVYQGSASKPAGNNFIGSTYDVGAIHDYRHYMYGLDDASGLVKAQNIRTYYYKGGATPNQEILRYHSAYITKSTTSSDPDCSSAYGSGGSTSIVGGASSTISHAALIAALEDTTEYRSSIIHTTYAAMNSPYALLDDCLLYLSEGNTQAAYTSYNAIAQGFEMLPEEEAEFEIGRLFVNMVARHYQDTISMDSLSTTDIDTLHYLLNNATMWAKTKACRWLEHAIGETCVPEAIEIPDTSGNNQRRAQEGLLSNGKEDRVQISPNPSRAYYDVTYSLQVAQNAELVITDLSGRKLSVVSLDYHNNNIRIDAQAWASGIYLYVVKQGAKTISNGKLIKQ